MNKGGSIDALNRWRMGVLSPGSAVVVIRGDTFFLGHLTLSNPEESKPHFVFTSSIQFVLQARNTLYTSTQMLSVTAVDLKENGYIASLLISIHFCSTLLHCQQLRLLMSQQITDSFESE